MLIAYAAGAPPQAVAGGSCPAEQAMWLDLTEPDEAEAEAVCRQTGLRVPAREEVAEIETSSRLRHEGAALYLSMPITAPNAAGVRAITPLGIVLSPHHVITLHYVELKLFTRVGEALGREAPGEMSSSLVFITLLEAIVDRLADLLEQVSLDLDALSRRVFHCDVESRRERHTDAMLRATLRRIGVAGDLISNLRASLLGLSRIAPYVADNAAFLPAELRPRLGSIKSDLGSLTEFDGQLMNKVQFLLDATLGFLNIEQNNGLKVLTVVSVVGIPPTLIASIYGMNFKNMPELNWSLGYPYGLAMIGLSIVLPLLLFRVKGWL